MAPSRIVTLDETKVKCTEKLGERESVTREKKSIEKEEEVESSSSNDSESGIHISSKEIKDAVALATASITKKFGWKDGVKTNTKTKLLSNPLSDSIPGYIAPMSLNSSSLDQFKSNKNDQIGSYTVPSNSHKMMVLNKSAFVSKNLKRTNKSIHTVSDKTNAGSGWFNFQATSNSSLLQADIAVIRNRNYLDPKKFYKSSDFAKKGSQMVQLGTVVEGSMESVYSNRLTKKQRKQTLMDEVMADVFASKNDYVTKKFGNIQREKSIAGQAFDKKRRKARR